jgi:glucose/arabinose dehydrogenase
LAPALAQTADVRTGSAAYGDWRSDAPGVRRHICPSDLPAPKLGTDTEEPDYQSRPKVVAPPQGAMPKVPSGFAVQVFASGLNQPRVMRIAPNGDIFVAESGSGRVLVFPAAASDVRPAKPDVFAENLDRPYGIVFQPPANPRYVYVGTASAVVRFAYHVGDVKAEVPAEAVIGNIPTKRHWTRDLAVSRNGNRLFVAIGSGSNLAGEMPEKAPEDIRQYEATHGVGAAWGEEENRAVVRVFDPEGKQVRNYATGLRNCSGLAMRPGTDELWCVVNERDHIGEDLPPDYMTHVQEGGFYGWPWYYIGDHEDPDLLPCHRSRTYARVLAEGGGQRWRSGSTRRNRSSRSCVRRRFCWRRARRWRRPAALWASPSRPTTAGAPNTVG